MILGVIPVFYGLMKQKMSYN